MLKIDLNLEHNSRTEFSYLKWFYDCGQNLVTNDLKHLMDQLEERILQTDQLTIPSKRLQHRVNCTLQCLFNHQLFLLSVVDFYGFIFIEDSYYCYNTNCYNFLIFK